MQLEDLGGGTVLQDLGIVSSAVAKPPYNYAPSAAVHGDSVFDRLIKLRDALYSDKTNEINAGIGGMDQSLDSIQHHLAKVGSIQNRMDDTEKRISAQEMYTNEVIERLNGLDMADAVTELKNLEMQYNAALQIGSRLLPKTLLDYLR
jgi:flagellar hook-associated protein 3 FlgL